MTLLLITVSILAILDCIFGIFAALILLFGVLNNKSEAVDRGFKLVLYSFWPLLFFVPTAIALKIAIKFST